MIVGRIVLVIANGNRINQSNAANQNPKLSIEDVKDRVIAQYPGEITEVEFDREHNREIYEVELVYEGMEYEFKIDANTGEVIKLKEKPLDAKEHPSKKEKDDQLVVIEKDVQKKDKSGKEKPKNNVNIDKGNDQKENQQKTEKPQKEKNNEQKQKVKQDKNQQKPQKPNKEKKKEKTVISLEKAIQIALNEFPGTVYEAELDREDGRLIYEIEIKANGEEADFDIDAFTGEIISIEIEEDD